MATRDYRDLTIIVPTLNESENLPLLLDALSEFPGVNVIISDDGSTDGTQDIVRERESESITLLDRSKEDTHGLTISVIDAIFATTTPFFIVMDGDFQHPPETIPDITEALREGSDLVVAIRTDVPGWKFHRKLMSKVAAIMGKIALFLRRHPSISDLLTGFFGGKTEFVQGVISDNRSSFQDQGYKILFDILKQLPRDFPITEVGYVFDVRKLGTSKIGIKHIIRYILSTIS